MLPRHIPAFPSRSYPLGAPGRGARNPALRDALPRATAAFPDGSARGLEVSLPPAPARRWGWRSTGRKPTQTLGDEHSREHRQTPRPGTGRGPGYLVSGSRGAASPQQPRAQSGRREAEREPGSRASGQLFTHSPIQSAPRSRRWGAGDCWEAPALMREGGVSREIGRSGLRVRVRRRPSLSAPPRCAT